MMPGYLLAAAFHKQAFASATQHQLLAFLQVAAFTNRTAVLPFARVGEPAFVGLPRPGFGGLDRGRCHAAGCSRMRGSPSRSASRITRNEARAVRLPRSRNCRSWSLKPG